MLGVAKRVLSPALRGAHNPEAFTRKTTLLHLGACFISPVYTLDGGHFGDIYVGCSTLQVRH